MVRETENFHSPGLKSSRCANAPRTFLNEDTCFLSTDPTTCDPGASAVGLKQPELLIPLNHNMIRAIFEESSLVAGAAVYLYAVDGLRISDDYTVTPPCRQSSISRWVPIDCLEVSGPSSIHPDSELALATLLEEALLKSENPSVVDIQLHETGGKCVDMDADKVGFHITDLQGKCWQNVHPDHLNVYDFTAWARNHPGGMLSLQSLLQRVVQH